MLATLVIGLWCCVSASAEVVGYFRVEGDQDKFYPVSFYDSQWLENTPTCVYVSRHNVHTDELWRGSMSARFEFHVTLWGNGAEYIRAEVQGNSPSLAHIQVHDFVAGWQDASVSNGDRRMVVWLRGGGMTYCWVANGDVAPMVYDGVANALPYQPDDYESFGVVTEIADYVKWSNPSYQDDLWKVLHVSDGRVGIGTDSPDAKLTVNGTIHTKEVVIDLQGPLADDVFESGYALRTLDQVGEYIKRNGHLPDVPSASEVACEGMPVGQFENLLLRKIEELTLYTLQLKSEIESLKTK